MIKLLFSLPNSFINILWTNSLSFSTVKGGSNLKLAILSFKLSEIDIFNNISGSKPVLLLDDIFSELDLRKRNKLLKIINDYDIQSIITTTDLKNINKKYLSNSYIFSVKAGNLERK